MIKRYGNAPESGRRYIRRPGVYAVLRLRDEILMTHQDSPVPEFQLPGGGIDAGEHPIAALHREVIEETGWHIGGLLRLGTFRRFTFMAEYEIWAKKSARSIWHAPFCESVHRRSQVIRRFG